jgi:predicted  nucleic acid-binding Zn-ribbon protein
MTWAACCDCGNHFERNADEHWRRRCIPCYRKSKRAESVSKPADSYWSDRAAAAESKAAVLQRQLEQQALTIRQLAALQAARPASSLDRELAENWRSLIQLVHPDRHGGSQGATRLTQWLNDIKGRLPCA